MYDIISFTSLSRLVKGKAEEITSTIAEGELIVDAKKLQTLFTLLYDGVSNNRASRETIRKMMIGQVAAMARKPELSDEDKEFIKTFSKQIIKNMKKRSHSDVTGCSKSKQKFRKQSRQPPQAAYNDQATSSSSSSSDEEIFIQPPPLPPKQVVRTNNPLVKKSKVKRKLIMNTPENIIRKKSKKVEKINAVETKTDAPRGKRSGVKATIPPTPIVFSGNNIDKNFFENNNNNKKRRKPPPQLPKIDEIWRIVMKMTMKKKVKTTSWNKIN